MAALHPKMKEAVLHTVTNVAGQAIAALENAGLEPGSVWSVKANAETKGGVVVKLEVEFPGLTEGLVSQLEAEEKEEENDDSYLDPGDTLDEDDED